MQIDSLQQSSQFESPNNIQAFGQQNKAKRVKDKVLSVSVNFQDKVYQINLDSPRTKKAEIQTGINEQYFNQLYYELAQINEDKTMQKDLKELRIKHYNKRIVNAIQILIDKKSELIKKSLAKKEVQMLQQFGPRILQFDDQDKNFYGNQNAQQNGPVINLEKNIFQQPGSSQIVPQQQQVQQQQQQQVQQSQQQLQQQTQDKPQQIFSTQQQQQISQLQFDNGQVMLTECDVQTPQELSRYQNKSEIFRDYKNALRYMKENHRTPETRNPRDILLIKDNDPQFPLLNELNSYNKIKKQQQQLVKRQFDMTFSNQLRQDEILIERAKRKQLLAKQKLKEQADEDDIKSQKKYLRERELLEQKEKLEEKKKQFEEKKKKRLEEHRLKLDQIKQEREQMELEQKYRKQELYDRIQRNKEFLLQQETNNMLQKKKLQEQLETRSMLLSKSRAQCKTSSNYNSIDRSLDKSMIVKKQNELKQDLNISMYVGKLKKQEALKKKKQKEKLEAQIEKQKQIQRIKQLKEDQDISQDKKKSKLEVTLEKIYKKATQLENWNKQRQQLFEEKQQYLQEKEKLREIEKRDKELIAKQIQEKKIEKMFEKQKLVQEKILMKKEKQELFLKAKITCQKQMQLESERIQKGLDKIFEKVDKDYEKQKERQLKQRIKSKTPVLAKIRKGINSNTFKLIRQIINPEEIDGRLLNGIKEYNKEDTQSNLYNNASEIISPEKVL